MSTEEAGGPILTAVAVDQGGAKGLAVTTPSIVKRSSLVGARCCLIPRPQLSSGRKARRSHPGGKNKGIEAATKRASQPSSPPRLKSQGALFDQSFAAELFDSLPASRRPRSASVIIAGEVRVAQWQCPALLDLLAVPRNHWPIVVIGRVFFLRLFEVLGPLRRSFCESAEPGDSVKGSGVRAQIASSASSLETPHFFQTRTNTATTIRAGPRRRKAATAARIVEPVARPSSIKMTVRSLTSGLGRSPR